MCRSRALTAIILIFSADWLTDWLAGYTRGREWEERCYLGNGFVSLITPNSRQTDRPVTCFVWTINDSKVKTPDLMLEWKLEHKQSSVFHHPTFFFSLCFCGPDWENVVYYGPLELTDWKSDHQIEISFPIFICYNWSQSRPHAKRNIPEMLCYWEGVNDNSCLVNTETKTRVHQFNLRLMSRSRRHHPCLLPPGLVGGGGSGRPDRSRNGSRNFARSEIRK